MDKRICGSLLNIVFITREILSPLHQLHLLLDIVLETGVAQLLVVGQTRTWTRQASE